MNDESRLIHEAVNGSSDAFGQLVQMHQDRLFNAMVHVVGSRVEAEDVTQEAFVQAYLKLSSFEGNSSFFTWLYRIAFNRAVSRGRRKRPRASVDEYRERVGADPVSPDESPTERVEREERAVQIQAALATLNEEHRTVIVLREIEGCDYEAIADILDLPVGTVRSRLHRARMQLREALQRTLKDEDLPRDEPE
jgi:RNA polymerase sigma-70 factor (ECF subfamily)